MTVLLFLGFVILLAAEFFLPTSGLLAIISVVLLVSANINAFSYSNWFGYSTLAASVVVTPSMLMLLVQVWPHTPIGRRILNLKPGKRVPRVTKHRTRDGHPLDQLIGERGVAKTDLLPSGLVLIGAHKYDAISRGELIEKGTPIEVASITAGKICVRKSTGPDKQKNNNTSSDNSAMSSNTQSSDAMPPTTMQSPSAMEIPLDSLEAD